jgi:hypothetical protein
MPTREEISEFSNIIVKMADASGYTCMDTIIEYCDKIGIEVEVAATLISASLKSRIREEAQSINLIKKSARLPLG